jgi:uncharacterized protein YggE
MKTRITLASLVIALLLITGCSAQELTTDDNQGSTITISGVGTASAVPDVVDIQLGVEAVSNEPVDAVSQSTSNMNAVRAVLDNMGVDPSDIQTVYYNMWVEEVYDQNGQVTGEKRYHVTNQVNIRLRDLDQIGTLLEKTTSAGATNVAGITFGVADTTELEQTALDNAISNANKKAERIASEMGTTLGTVVNMVEGGFYIPPSPYFGEKTGLGGGSAVPISQGQFSMTVQIQVVYNLAP